MRTKRHLVTLKPVELKITDDGDFYDVALFLDNEEVLNTVYAIRKEWTADKLVENKEIDSFIDEERDSREMMRFWGNYKNAVAAVKRLGYRFTYVPPFIAAILSGVVTDKDYSTVLKEHPLYDGPKDIYFEPIPVFTSESIRVKDLSKIKGKRDTKAIDTIRRDREWYWICQKISEYRFQKILVNKEGSYILTQYEPL